MSEVNSPSARPGIRPGAGPCLGTSHWGRRKLIAVAMLLALGLGGCALPSQGPSAQVVMASSASQNYELVTLTQKNALRMGGANWSGFPAEFLRAPLLSTGGRLGVGDRLSVTIFEAGPDGLFSASGNNGTVTIPNIEIGADGTISLPYAGKVRVRNLTPAEVEAEVVEALQGKAIEPQVVVTVMNSANNSVTVIGEVARPARVPLGIRGETLSAVLAAVGGARFPAHEVKVSVNRKGVTGSASLQRIVEDPAQDIALRPDDRITFTRAAGSYTVFGSVNLPSNVPFAEARMTLLEAIGKSSGLLDERADSSGVFLFRREATRTLEQQGLAPKLWWRTEKNAVPTVYRLDFSQPEALFIAQSVQMRDGDVIYVASAGAVQLSKALRLFGLAVGSARTAAELTQ
jgi:polysaccharide export outer membrane protein